jgi:uncharacterized protein (TIGR02266 family)
LTFDGGGPRGNTGGRPKVSAPGTVRVRLRYADLETFIEKFAPNVTRGGIFLASRTPRPEGEVFAFEVQLATGAVALAGEGKVTWVKPFNAAEPQKPHGMGVQFVRLDAQSRETLNRILQVKGPGRRGTQPLQTLSAGAAAAVNGRARVDTSVDLAQEYGIDESALRRIIDRNWTMGVRADEDVEELLRPEPAEPATLAQALAELPRLLDPAVRRRTGAFRTLEALAAAPPAERRMPPAFGENGTASASASVDVDVQIEIDVDPNEITSKSD